MDNRGGAIQSVPEGAELTVREIRGLLMKHAEEVVQSMATESPALEATAGARVMSFREFARSMSRFLSMN